MGAIITFGMSLVLLSGFLALKVWERAGGRMPGEGARRALDAWVVRCARAAVDVPPKLSVLCWCAARNLASRVRAEAPHLIDAARGHLDRALERIRSRRFSEPRTERGEASEFLKNVSEHKNGIRNGNSH